MNSVKLMLGFDTKDVETPTMAIMKKTVTSSNVMAYLK